MPWAQRVMTVITNKIKTSHTLAQATTVDAHNSRNIGDIATLFRVLFIIVHLGSVTCFLEMNKVKGNRQFRVIHVV